MSSSSHRGSSLERQSILQEHEAEHVELSVSSSTESDGKLARRRDTGTARQQLPHLQPSSNTMLLPPVQRRLSRHRSGALLSTNSLATSTTSSPYAEVRAPEADEAFRVGCRRVHVSMGKAALSWQYDSQCLGLTTAMRPPRHVLLAEVVAVRQLSPSSTWQDLPLPLSCCSGGFCPPSAHRVVIYSIHRKRRRQWGLQTLILQTSSAQAALEWSSAISLAADKVQERPKELLVFLNPHGGARLAAHVWSHVAAPIFDLAGVTCTVVTTERANHCRAYLEGLPTEELAAFDGVVVVGGDGLFQEALNAVITIRAGGGDKAAAAVGLRLGHIPAGSTDAVAYSLSGSRSQETAALHIALGDRLAMDVMRVDTAAGERRFSCCVAAYGYMGDLMAQSERMRSLGPARYNIAGALTLFRSKSYRARVRWLPSRVQSYTARRICGAQCDWCASCGSPRGAAIRGELSPDVFGDSSASVASAAAASAAVGEGNPAELQDGWREEEGEFAAIMAVVMPCRSDRSDLGLAPYAHLSDGIIHLILVRKCSALQYLRFLVSIPQRGVIPEDFEYVDGFDASAVTVEPIGTESSWSVDGEVMSNNHISACVFRGLVDVFARGVET